jgi:hypothetical protein
MIAIRPIRDMHQSNSPASSATVSATTNSIESIRWVSIVALIAYLAAIPFFYRFCAQQPISPDPFMYGEIAKEMLAGKKLYTEAWQDKAPLAFVPYMLPQALGFHDYPALGFAGGIAIAAEAAMLFIYFRKNPPAAWACVFFVTLLPATNADFDWPSLEHFASPFMTGMLLLGLTIYRRKSVQFWQTALLGALGIITFHIRQQMAIVGILPLAAILFSRESNGRKTQAVLTCAAVGAACWGAILLWVWRVGDLAGYYHVVFEYPRLYIHQGSYSGLLDLVNIFLQSPLPLLLFFSAGIAMLGDFRRPVIFSLLVVTYIVAMPLRGFGHYLLIIFPFIAIYISLSMESPAISMPSARWAGTWAILLLGAIGIVDRVRSVLNMQTYSALVTINDFMEKSVPPHSKLLVCGQADSAGLVYISRLPAANMFNFALQFNEPWVSILPTPIDRIFDGYLNDPPDVIFVSDDYLNEAGDEKIDRPSNPARLIRLLASRYRWRVPAPFGGFHLLIRIPDAGPGQ